MTPPTRALLSRTMASTPSFFRVCAQTSPLIPAPTTIACGLSLISVDQRAFDDFRQRTDKRGIAVQCGNAFEVADAGLSGDFIVENIELVKRFDVFRYKTDGHNENVVDASLTQINNGVVRHWR